MVISADAKTADRIVELFADYDGLTEAECSEAGIGEDCDLLMEVLNMDGYVSANEKAELKKAGFAMKFISNLSGPDGRCAQQARIKWLFAEGESDLFKRKKVPSRLAEMGESAVPALVEAMGDESEKVRIMASSALGQIGPAALPFLSKAMAHKNNLVRRYAADAIGVLGPEAKMAVGVLIKAIDDKDEKVRDSAVKALGKIGPDADKAVTRLIKMMKEGDEVSVPEACEALGLIGAEPEKVVPALMEVLDRVNRGEFTWNLNVLGMRPATALGRFGGDAEPAVGTLTELLGSQWEGVRREAAEALGNIGPAARPAVPALIKILDDEFIHARIEAVRALGKIGDRAALPALRALAAGDPHPVVKMDAATAIEKIGR